MSTKVPFITAEDGDDLIVSFALGQYAETSLTLLRTPKYESLLPEDERGVSVGTGAAENGQRELLVSVHWNDKSVKITSNLRVYEPDTSAVESEELLEAKDVLGRMNFDSRFTVHGG